MDSIDTEVLSSENSAVGTAGTSSSKRRWRKMDKRAAEPVSEAEAAELQLQRIRHRLASTPRSELNACMVLNEYRKGLNYELVNQAGPVHSPIYTLHLTIDGQVFDGSGSTKQKAKLAAAEAALHVLFSDILPPSDVVSTSSNGCDMQPTSCSPNASEGSLIGTNPTIVLNQLRPGTTYEDVDIPVTDVTSCTGVTPATYCVSCIVDDVTYTGTGSNKKLAKARTAAEALEKAFGISCTQIANGFPLFVGELPPAQKRKVSDAKSRTAATQPAAEAVKPPELLCSVPGDKHPVVFVHELYPTAEYTSSEVPDEQGVFRASISVESQLFEGAGTSKKAARTAAAINIVNYLHQNGFLALRVAEKVRQKKSSKWQHQSDAQFPLSLDGGVPSFLCEIPHPSQIQMCKVNPATRLSPELIKLPELSCSVPGDKHPVMFIHELYPAAEYSSSEVPDEQGVFRASIPIEGQTFEGLGTTKKAARTSAAISAVNFLHQTGYMTMRLAEKASQKKPKWQPPSRAYYSQENAVPARGGFFGRRGSGKLRGGLGRGALYSSLRSAYSACTSKDANWISGGVLKAGDFMGMNSAPPGVAANEMQFSSDQEYYQQTGYTTDDSYTTANSSFGFASPYGPMHGGFKKESPNSQQYVAYAGGHASTPGSYGGPHNSTPVSFGKHNVRGGMGNW